MTGWPLHSHPIPSESHIQLFSSALGMSLGSLGLQPYSWWSPLVSCLLPLSWLHPLPSPFTPTLCRLLCQPFEFPSPKDVQLGSAGHRDPASDAQTQKPLPSISREPPSPLLSEKALGTDMPYLLPSSCPLFERVLISAFLPCLPLSDPITSSLVESDA